MNNHFPCTRVVFILFGREFCNPQGIIRCFDCGFRTSSAQRGARSKQHFKPPVIENVFVLFKSERCSLQVSESCPWRSSHLRFTGKEGTVFLKSKTQSTHSSFIVNAKEIVSFGQFAWLPAFLFRKYCFTAFHQQPSPSIRAGIREKAKKRFVSRSELPTLEELQVRIESKMSGMICQPFCIIFKETGFFSAQEINEQAAHQGWL